APAGPIKQQAAASPATLARRRPAAAAHKCRIFREARGRRGLACFLLTHTDNSAQGANARRRRRPSCFLLVPEGTVVPSLRPHSPSSCHVLFGLFSPPRGQPPPPAFPPSLRRLLVQQQIGGRVPPAQATATQYSLAVSSNRLIFHNPPGPRGATARGPLIASAVGETCRAGRRRRA